MIVTIALTFFVLRGIITRKVKLRGEGFMKVEMSKREQKYYYAVFKATNIDEFECENRIKLFQFAEVHCKTSSDSLNEHKQWCHEITFVYGGEGDIIHNGERQRIKSGQVHLCFDEDMHQIIPSKTSPLRFYCIGFTLPPSNQLSVLLDEVRRSIGAENSILRDCADLQSAFRLLMNSLYAEEQNDLTKAVATNTLNYIISSVFDGFLKKENMGGDKLSIKESLLFFVASYLKSNVYSIDALSRLPADIGYSYSYISHLFSQKMGQTLKSFFINLRMDTADKLLCEKSVTEVSELLGYSSIHAFSRAYKTVRGSLPNTVRKRTDS